VPTPETKELTMLSKILNCMFFTCKLYSLLLAKNGLLMVDWPSDDWLTEMLDFSSSKRS
jgi:hypothetical protein